MSVTFDLYLVLIQFFVTNQIRWLLLLYSVLSTRKVTYFPRVPGQSVGYYTCSLYIWRALGNNRQVPYAWKILSQRRQTCSTVRH